MGSFWPDLDHVQVDDNEKTLHTDTLHKAWCYYLHIFQITVKQLVYVDTSLAAIVKLPCRGASFDNGMNWKLGAGLLTCTSSGQILDLLCF
jgi:hypothetical protein